MRQTPVTPPELNSQAVAVSAEIVQANARLLTLRKQRSVTRGTVVLKKGGWLSPLNTVASTTVSEGTSCPDHEQPAPSSTHLTAYPDILHAILRREEATIGRIWLLCRLIDQKGRGVLSIDTVRDALSSKPGRLYICGWRRLRQLLAAGEGTYWHRDSDGRLWLSGRAKLATALGVEHLQQRAVSLPLSVLTSSLGDVKAHFMASIHSSRSADCEISQPISRTTLRKLSGVSERSQARYDQRAGIVKRQAMAIGGRFSAETRQQRQWQGKSTFQFTDHTGKHGPVAACYIAWHLPNQYVGLHDVASKASRRRVNRQLSQRQIKQSSRFREERLLSPTELNDLAATGARGNGQLQANSRLFFNDGRGGKGATESYWSSNDQRVWYFRPNLTGHG